MAITLLKSWLIFKFDKLFSWHFDIREKKGTMWKLRNCKRVYNAYRFKKMVPGLKIYTRGGS